MTSGTPYRSSATIDYQIDQRLVRDSIRYEVSARRLHWPSAFHAGCAPLFGGTRPLFYGLVQTRNTLRLPAYARLDVRADRTFTWSARRMTLFVEVANALNHQNLRNVPYGVDRTGRVQEPTDTLLPIIPSAGMVIEF